MEALAGGGADERDRSDARPDGTTQGCNSTNCTAIEGNALSFAFAPDDKRFFARRTESRANKSGDSRRNTRQASELRAALAFAEIGLRPIPLDARLLPARKGWTTATADPRDVAARFADVWNPGGVALVTGAGVGAVDLDRGHPDGADGIAEFTKLLDGRPFPKGPRWRTKRGGLQILLRFQSDMRLRNLSGKSSLAPGVEFKGDNAAARVPPTPQYTWIISPWDAPIPDAPDWLIPLVQKKPAASMHLSVPSRKWTGRYDPYLTKVLANETAKVANAGPGARTMPLFEAACRLGEFVAGGEMRRDDVVAALMNAARKSGLVAQDGEVRVQLHITNGLAKGAAKPRTSPVIKGCP